MATFLEHTSCPNCGSSDAGAVYDDGSCYCHKCNSYWRQDGHNSKGRNMRGKPNVSLLSGKFTKLDVRGISRATCSRYGYRVGNDWDNRPVHIAEYRKDGQVVAQKLRYKDKDFSFIGSTSNIELFGQHLARTGGKRIVITEGEIDALSVAQAFNLSWPVVSVPNGAAGAKRALSNHLEFLNSYDEIVLAFDNDEAGIKAIHECAPMFSPGKVKIAEWGEHKDANEVLLKEGPKRIVQVVFEARLYRPDGIIEGSALRELLMSERTYPSYDLQYPLWNKSMRGLRKGEITLFTAGTGIGKTTLVKEVGYHLMMEHNQKLGIIALEESNEKTALSLMAIHLNKPLGDLFLDRSIVSEKAYKEAMDACVCNGRLFMYNHFGSLESSNLLAKMRYLALGCGVDWILFDHISIAVSGLESTSERKDIDILMTNGRSLVENTGVGMLMISHLVKGTGGQSHEEGGRVTLNDLRGSGTLKQLPDNIIALERDSQSSDKSNYSTIRMLKCRLFGEGCGVQDTLEYRPETGRLLPASFFESTEFTTEEF